DAEGKRKGGDEAMQPHHKALAHLATREGRNAFAITAGQPHVLWFEDGKGGKQAQWMKSEVLTAPAEKGSKEEHRSLILRVNPDEKYDKVHGKIIELEKAAKENPKALRFIEVQPDYKIH